MRYKSFKEIIKQTSCLGRTRISVAAADDPAILKAVKIGMEAGVITPILVGKQSKIEQLASGLGLGLGEVDLLNAQDARAASLNAVKVVSDGKADVLMKGFVNTSDFMHAVLHPEYGLRTGKLLSHIAVFEVPGFDRLIFSTDGGINVSPDLSQKVAILSNAVEFMLALGYDQPYVAILAANEEVNPKITATSEAAVLSKMAERGHFRGALVDGPLALDLAISPEAARRKGIRSEVAGKADLLLCPSIEVGNVLGKSLLYFAQAQMAGIVLGAKAPVILTSRLATPEEKLNSLAIACLARRKRENKERKTLVG